MNIIIDIGHPGHVHLLKNFYFQLKENGHKIIVTVKDIKIVKHLLTNYNIAYTCLGTKYDSIPLKIISQILYNLRLLNLVIKERIDIGIGTSATIAYVSKFTKMKSIILDDDDDDVQPLFTKFVHPFADTILSPEALIGKRKNKRTIFYKGYHELAYLHPNRFKSNPRILKREGLEENDTFFIMRFNVFKAHHDVGINGLNLKQKLKLIELLEPFGKILITTERNIELELEKYQLKIPPDEIHSLIYFATMFIGDSQTMTSEAAVLGTPAIRCNDFVGRISYLEEEEHTYGLTYGFKPRETDKMFSKIVELLHNTNLDKEWLLKRDKLFSNKIDVTAFLVWFVENYPESAKIMKKNPSETQMRFL